MKVLCDRERLRDALSVTGSVIPLKSTRPAIENVCLVALDDALELVGTDLEISIRYRIDEVKIEEPGTALIPARIAADFVKELSGETIELVTRDERCVITSGSDRCELVSVDPDEFPVVARFPDDERALQIQAGQFAKLVTRTGFASAREPGRYAMHGILNVVEEGVYRMVATDGRRLAVASLPLEKNGQPPRRAIVPTKGMQLFCKVVADPLAPMAIHFGESQLGVRTESAEVFARLIDGDFPRYAAVIPVETRNAVEADAELLNRKLRMVANVTSGDTRAVRLSLDKRRLTLLARSAACGEATAQMDVQYHGEATDIAFNPDFVMDGLKNCESDVVRLEFNERTSPGKFTLGENYLYIVMPITTEA